MIEPKEACPIPIYAHWHTVSDRLGWYVADPYGHDDGPYDESTADRLCRDRQQLYPVEGCTCA